MEGSECLQGEEVKTEYRKLFQGVCYRERLRDGTVSGGACTGRRVLCFKQEQLQAVCMLIGVSQ